jgi:gentisate 1,2-dioxygenase
MCCQPGFVAPFREHRQSIFSIILMGPRIFGMVTGKSLQLAKKNN